jgi:predicted MFS family arabinose efflux permease
VTAEDERDSRNEEPGLHAKSTTVLSDRAVSLLAVASAVAVANAYYIQPLLVEVGGALSISSGLVGILPALSQIGLACGLAFLLPLGDMVSARRLLLTVIPIQIAGLVLFALSGSAFTVSVASLLIGLFGITPYILPPYASLHVPASRLGHVTGMLTRGVIIGILLARTASGIIATHFGWRAVYGIAAIVMTMLLVFLARVVKPEPAVSSQSVVRYRDLIGSLAHLLRTVPELRIAALCQALSFGSFNVFWLGATLYLQSPEFSWTPQAVGLVGIVGAAAASAAPMFGRFIDRSGPRAARRAALAGMVIAWILLAVFKGHLVGMVVGLIILDIGATVADISNRTILYGLDAGIRTRLNAIYQVAMFSGGAIMSVLVGVCWSLGGWFALCALGVVPVVIAFLRCWRSVR